MATMSRADDAVATESTETIARYTSYEDAEAAVDRLATMQFPVERVSIIAEGLRMVEHVTGRRGIGTAIGSGAAGGALIGVVFGWFFGLFGLAEPLVHGIVLGWWGLVIGIVLGAVAGALTYWIAGQRRRFDSVSAVQADSYCLVTSTELAARAATLIRRQAPAAGGPRG